MTSGTEYDEAKQRQQVQQGMKSQRNMAGPPLPADQAADQELAAPAGHEHTEEDVDTFVAIRSIS